MSHAETCPVCNGRGGICEKIDWDDTTATKTYIPTVTRCHGCSGKGWVEVQDSYPRDPNRPYWQSSTMPL